MKRMLAILLLVSTALAADSSWQSLATIRAGQKVEVRTSAGTFKGEFVRFDPQGLTIREKKGERSLAQAEVTKVTLAKSSRGLWIGLAVGAAGGLVAGAALGARLENESGGDFTGIKSAVIGGCAAGGALIGLAVGAAVRRGRVVYER